MCVASGVSIVGNAVGHLVTAFLSANTWTYAVGSGVVLAGIVYFGVRAYGSGDLCPPTANLIDYPDTESS